MGYSNDRQRSQACYVLLSLVDLESFWQSTDLGSGPTEGAAIAVRALNQGHRTMLSFGEGIMLRVAFDLWNGGGGVSLWEMLEHLEPDHVVAIGDLLLRAAQDAPELIDDWIEDWSDGGPEELTLST